MDHQRLQVSATAYGWKPLYISLLQYLNGLYHIVHFNSWVTLSMLYQNILFKQPSFKICYPFKYLLITAFATQKSSLTTNFPQQSLRNLVQLRFIWMKLVEDTLLYLKVRSTAFLLMFLASRWPKTPWEKLISDVNMQILYLVSVSTTQAVRFILISVYMYLCGKIPFAVYMYIHVSKRCCSQGYLT